MIAGGSGTAKKELGSSRSLQWAGAVSPFFPKDHRNRLLKGEIQSCVRRRCLADESSSTVAMRATI